MRHSAYADDSKLATRHHLHSFNMGPMPSDRGRLFAVFEPRGDEVVIDVGCGNGRDIRALAAAGHAGQLIGLDLSPGMLRSVGVPPAELVCADAAALPIRSGAGDLVLAMSMLYHVPELDEALAEVRRVLRPGGTFLSSASSTSNMTEFVDAWELASADVTGVELGVVERWARNFNIENGAEVLRRVFNDVQLHRFEWTVAPPEPRFVREYAESSRDFYEDLYPAGTWSQVMDRLEWLVTEEFERNGGFQISVRKGIFVAR